MYQLVFFTTSSAILICEYFVLLASAENQTLLAG